MAMMGAKTYQKTALITGASTGIGKAAALALMKTGYRAVLITVPATSCPRTNGGRYGRRSLNPTVRVRGSQELNTA
jgi:short chain dehydrogenase